LPEGLIRAALLPGRDALEQAARDRGKLSRLIADYKTARPGATRAQVVEALSTAYCRAVSADQISAARMSAKIADFAQSIAVLQNGGAAAP
jgi:hypothetical protein